MANPNAAHEPSMEEILASIRQIISEDGGAGSPTIDGVKAERGSMAVREKPAEPGVEPEEPSAADEHAPSEEPEPGIEPEPDYGAFMRHSLGSLPEPAAEPEPKFEPVRTAVARLALQPDDDGPLLSEESGSAISDAFGSLAQTFLAHNARTLEDVVTEMLQPMLKQWLDDNLPSIVERKVKEEIERVSRGRR